MDDVSDYPLAVQLGLGIGELAQARARARIDLVRVTARMQAPELAFEDMPRESTWLLDALQGEIARSTFDLELQAMAQRLVSELRTALLRAEQYLDAGLMVVVKDDSHEILELGSPRRFWENYDRVIPILAATSRTLRELAFRLSGLSFIVSDDGSEFWGTDAMNQYRAVVAGPVSEQPDGGYKIGT